MSRFTIRELAITAIVLDDEEKENRKPEKKNRGRGVDGEPSAGNCKSTTHCVGVRELVSRQGDYVMIPISVRCRWKFHTNNTERPELIRWRSLSEMIRWPLSLYETCPWLHSRKYLNYDMGSVHLSGIKQFLIVICVGLDYNLFVYRTSFSKMNSFCYLLSYTSRNVCWRHNLPYYVYS